MGTLWPVADSEPRHRSDREQLFEAVYRVLAGLAARQPVLLILEDVHWIDASSRDLLSFVVHNARRDRLVVVATYRPDELHRGHPLRPFVAELERSGRAERLELGGLDRVDVTELIRSITGRQLPGGTIDSIFARSEGNPFFVEELLAGRVQDCRARFGKRCFCPLPGCQPRRRRSSARPPRSAGRSFTGCWRAWREVPSAICSRPCERRTGCRLSGEAARAGELAGCARGPGAGLVPVTSSGCRSRS